jgi:hypothetical protein
MTPIVANGTRRFYVTIAPALKRWLWSMIEAFSELAPAPDPRRAGQNTTLIETAATGDYGVLCGADCKLSGMTRFGVRGEAIRGSCLLAG